MTTLLQDVSAQPVEGLVFVGPYRTKHPGLFFTPSPPPNIIVCTGCITVVQESNPGGLRHSEQHSCVYSCILSVSSSLLLFTVAKKYVDPSVDF